ncbi:MAG TPA: TetR/AcrR family transcriptional regulator [Candidatus Limnocylindria bacterium]|nr:TetR/AcrR family transcriptional regulator [Candidatus Limnocylindria bacterium]
MGRSSDAKERLMDAVTELIWHGSYGGTTIDHICEKAGVKKGSFYYFFDSKSDLAAAALEATWQQKKPELDAMFSPTVPPMDRLRRFCEMGYEKQKEMQQQCGCVLGCPLFTLGAEVCNQEEKLHKQIKVILANYHTYIESAIRDAHVQGLIDAPDAASKARMLFAYSEGLLTQARILNDAEVLREMTDGVLGILGAKAPQRKAA